MPAQPVVLASSVVSFPGGVNSGLATRLRNEDSVGVLISKLAFHIVPGANPALTTTLDFYVRLTYKGIPITNGWIPVHSFCWPQSEALAMMVGPVLPLASPIYLGPGDWVDVSILPGPTLTGAISMVASAHAIQSAEPSEKWLPYLTYFQGAQRNVNTAAGTFIEVSTPQDLGNPFDNDLRIDRLLGTVLTQSALFGSSLWAAPPNPYQQFFVVTLSDDRDNLWISNPTPIHTAFNSLTRSWKMNTILPPKGYIRVQIEGVATGFTAPAASILETPLIGMVGYRRIYG